MSKNSMNNDEKRKAMLAIEKKLREAMKRGDVSDELATLLGYRADELQELAFIDDEPFLEQGGTEDMHYVRECFVSLWGESRIDSAIGHEPQTSGWYGTIRELLRIGYEFGYDNGVASHLRATTIKLHKDEVRMGFAKAIPEP